MGDERLQFVLYLGGDLEDVAELVDWEGVAHFLVIKFNKIMWKFSRQGI